MIKNKPLVSILVANYNNEKFLSRSINSCLKQKYSNLEILVHDDNSSDNSVKKLNTFKKNPKVKIFYNKSKKQNIAALDAANSYYKIFKKSKGSIICILDSDDYFHINKVRRLVQIFNKKKNICFIQNLPKIKKEKKFLKKKNINSRLSFWPYLAPESCISFRRDFMINFLKINKPFKKDFKSIWLGFRMGTYAYYCTKQFFSLNEHLTYYESLGESKKYTFFGKKWMQRRKDSFEYLKKIVKKRQILNKNVDYLFTKIFSNIYKLKL